MDFGRLVSQPSTMKKRPPRRIIVGFRLVEALRDLLSGISSYAKQNQRDWQVQCVDADEFEPNLRHRSIDGALAVISPASKDILKRVGKSEAPLVNLLHDVHPHLPSVLSDDRAIGATGAQYLKGLGFRHFAFLGINSQWSNRRQDGFTGVLASAGLGCHASDAAFQVADYRFLGTGRSLKVLRKWIGALPKPVALMACADVVARAALLACQQLELQVPQDVAILGVDNLITTCELASVPLSSVAQDFARLGYEASRVLDRLMTSGRAPVGPVLVAPGDVAVRRSTNILSFDDPKVAAAMRIIHERAASGMSVKELMRQVPGSRKWLDTRFKLLVGHTPSEEIRRWRLARVRELLLQTDLTVHEIAGRCGFSRAENLIRFFRDAQGMPPQQYRTRNRIQPVASQ
jgi:LacI family transcriptional regulator